MTWSHSQLLMNVSRSALSCSVLPLAAHSPTSNSSRRAVELYIAINTCYCWFFRYAVRSAPSKGGADTRYRMMPDFNDSAAERDRVQLVERLSACARPLKKAATATSAAPRPPIPVDSHAGPTWICCATVAKIAPAIPGTGSSLLVHQWPAYEKRQ